MSDEAPAIDFDAVLREIDEEVRAKRASGDIPADLEQELDRLFAQYVPAAAAADDLNGLLNAARRSSFIDPEPPTMASRVPGVSMLKTMEHKLLGWYFRFLAQQVTAFAHTLTQAVEALTKRVDALSASTQAGARALEKEGRRVQALPSPAVGDAAATVADHFAGAVGRVLVVEAGDGSLLRALAERDVDVYGIDPSSDRVATLAADGLDVRDDGALLHLHSVGPRSLGGLVLAGCVDRLPLDGQVELADVGADVLAPGAAIAVVGRSPLRWGEANPVEADLSPGRPLHAATWVHLLAHRGFTGLTVDEGDTYVVRGRREA